MLDSNVDSLGDDSLSYSLVDDDSECMRCHIEDATSPSMIKLERHSLLKGSIALHVDQLSSLVCPQIRCQMLDSIILELLGEHVSRSSSISLRVGHDDGDGCQILFSKN